jgi:hypothetical protein
MFVLVLLVLELGICSGIYFFKVLTSASNSSDSNSTSSDTGGGQTNADADADLKYGG